MSFLRDLCALLAFRLSRSRRLAEAYERRARRARQRANEYEVRAARATNRVSAAEAHAAHEEQRARLHQQHIAKAEDEVRRAQRLAEEHTATREQAERKVRRLRLEAARLNELIRQRHSASKQAADDVAAAKQRAQRAVREAEDQVKVATERARTAWGVAQKQQQRAEERRTVAIERYLKTLPDSDSSAAALRPLRANWFDRDPLPVELLQVIDGDSVRIRVVRPGARSRRTNEVRLVEIDAPEHDQPFGQDAERALREIVRGKRLWMYDFGLDLYGRSLGVLLVTDQDNRLRAGRSVNREMVRLGMAVWYSQFSHHPELEIESAQAEAKSRRIGIWAKPDGVDPPWEHRRQARDEHFGRARPR